MLFNVHRYGVLVAGCLGAVTMFLWLFLALLGAVLVLFCCRSYFVLTLIPINGTTLIRVDIRILGVVVVALALFLLSTQYVFAIPPACLLLFTTNKTNQFDSLVEHGDPEKALESNRARRMAAKARQHARAEAAAAAGAAMAAAAPGGTGGGEGGAGSKRRRPSNAASTAGLKQEAILAMKKVGNGRLPVFLAGFKGVGGERGAGEGRMALTDGVISFSARGEPCRSAPTFWRQST